MRSCRTPRWARASSSRQLGVPVSRGRPARGPRGRHHPLLCSRRPKPAPVTWPCRYKRRDVLPLVSELISTCGPSKWCLSGPGLESQTQDSPTAVWGPAPRPLRGPGPVSAARAAVCRGEQQGAAGLRTLEQTHSITTSDESSGTAL